MEELQTLVADICAALNIDLSTDYISEYGVPCYAITAHVGTCKLVLEGVFKALKDNREDADMFDHQDFYNNLIRLYSFKFYPHPQSKEGDYGTLAWTTLH